MHEDGCHQKIYHKTGISLYGVDIILPETLSEGKAGPDLVSLSEKKITAPEDQHLDKNKFRGRLSAEIVAKIKSSIPEKGETEYFF